MGQRQGLHRCSQRYGNCSTTELQHLVVRRGLAQTRGGGLFQADRSTLIALLKAYDAGAEAAGLGELSGRSNSLLGDGDADVIQQILCTPGPKGMDIGGTLVKMVLALQQEVASEYVYPESFGMTGKTRYDLEFGYRIGETMYVARFLSGATAQLNMAIGYAQKLIRSVPASPSPSSNDLTTMCVPEDGDEAGDDSAAESVDGRESAEKASCPEVTEDAVYSKLENLDMRTVSTTDSPPPSEGQEERLPPAIPRGCSSASSTGFSTTALHTAGGGAHKFAPLFREALQVELEPVKELEAVVDGLLFLHEHGPPDELFTVDADKNTVPTQWLEPLFPFLLVNMGSGVSILKVSSSQPGDYVRVGGTACGGGTFLGLARALTSAETFEEALELAEKGDASKCDLLVQDIYGSSGSDALGLPGALTASNFGRLCEPPGHENVPDMAVCAEQDMVRALLQMVTQQSVLLASAMGRNAGCVNRVFFVGGFVEQENRLARATISANFRSLGGQAYFLRHSDFLGALGSLRHCLQQEQSGEQREVR